MNNRKTLEEIKRYNTFVYDGFDISYQQGKLDITYYYEIINLKKFVHRLSIPYSSNNVDKEFVEKLVFNIGLLEAVSYWKATIAPKLIIKCGTITEKQKDFFRKIYYYGLGEFFYLNKIEAIYDEFVQFECTGKQYDKKIEYDGLGSMIAIGGGKDSCVTLSLCEKENSSCFIINPKDVMLECAYVAGYQDHEIYKVKRMIDKGLLELNAEGFLNGHTPFSAMVAFVSFLTAYLNHKKYIVLSNESSANEANVCDTKINHQYSKSYEFEQDFQNYASEFLNKDIKYYSFLRPLSEYQIGMLFSRDKKFHKIFKSCNVGSKNENWKWCCNCAKCLFVYCLLSPFLYQKELVDIFGKDLFETEDLLPIFIDLIGKGNTKPFDCVGTFEEINYAITRTIKNLDQKNLPFLLNYYFNHYYDEEILRKDLEHDYNENNSLSEYEIRKIKEVISDDK